MLYWDAERERVTFVSSLMYMSYMTASKSGADNVMRSIKQFDKMQAAPGATPKAARYNKGENYELF